MTPAPKKPNSAAQQMEEEAAAQSGTVDIFRDYCFRGEETYRIPLKPTLKVIRLMASNTV